MSNISLTRTHSLGMQGARIAAEKMVVRLRSQLGISGKWEGDTLYVNCHGVKGRLTVTATEIVLEITLGFLFSAMKSSIERTVQEEIDNALQAPQTHQH